MNALEHITVMEKLSADPSSDVSLFLKRNLNPFELMTCTLKLFGVAFFLLRR